VTLVPLQDGFLDGPIGLEPPAERRDRILALEKEGQHIVYLLPVMDLMEFRMARNWLRDVAGNGRLPDGPLVMASSAEGLASRLGEQFEPGHVQIWKRDPR
jgi:hypothetical protein